MKVKHLALGVAGALVLIAALPTPTEQTNVAVTDYSNTECRALADIGENITRSRDKGVAMATSLTMTRVATEMASKGNKHADQQLYNNLKEMTVRLYANRSLTPAEVHRLIYNACVS